MLASLYPVALKAKAIRTVPEGMCKRCLGAGNGEEAADLGEARCHGSGFPMRKCASCGGSGLAAATTKITAQGLLLLALIAAATWVSPILAVPILAFAILSITVVDAMQRREQQSGKLTAPPTPPANTETFS